MNSIIKVPLSIALLFFLLSGCIIQNPKAEECEVITITVAEIEKGVGKDIILKDQDDDQFYITRGLEKGLRIPDLEARVLDKEVTLYLPAFPLGNSSPHIAQLEVNDTVIYTEFN